MKAIPLFNEKILQKQLDSFQWPPHFMNKQAIILRWINTLRSGALHSLTESTLKVDFLKDIFESILGYPGVIAGTGLKWNLHPEKITTTGSGFADGALGYFEEGKDGKVIVAIELKGADLDLDKQHIKGITPVQQGWRYANETMHCRWIIVSNFEEIRLYNKATTPLYYEKFLLDELEDIKVFKKFYFLLCKDNLLSENQSAIELILEETRLFEEEITDKLYKDYKEIRWELLQNLKKNNTTIDENDLVSHTQKILDRIIFISFCESRWLLPINILKDTYERRIPGLSNWMALVYLFRAINVGDSNHKITGYNGGLFAEDPEIDSLVVDDDICKLFLKLNEYDYQSEVSVNVLGHIFEQSITDIEILKEENTLLVDPRRKKEGIYYTPDFITRYIVKETIGSALEQKFDNVYKKHNPDKIKSLTKQKKALKSLWYEYRDSLKSFRICDPACGSGAFLVAAFDYLYNEYEKINKAITRLEALEKKENLKQIEGQISLLDLNKEILNNNLFGVDINSESVEITKLSLWIKTAEKDKQLTFLDGNIKCGNSLINDDTIDPVAFNWTENFPEVFKDGGFDVVIGNPPYIKLQNFKSIYPEQADWIINNYESAKTGNFDMYLPFIEKGISLLSDEGRMGFIAPSVWLLNDYGKGLRKLCAENNYVYKWIDFKSYQVFKDVTTYTALQFFSKQSSHTFDYALAPEGDLAILDWTTIEYNDQISKKPWVLVTDKEEKIILSIKENTLQLEEVSNIIVGVQTSADKLYHMSRTEPGKYFSRIANITVKIEDEIMKPLVNGEKVIKYAVPITDIYILFPYDLTQEKPKLWSQREMEDYFPFAWKYLCLNERFLRNRENGKMDKDESWWGYNYPKNLSKQNKNKIMVPRLVSNLKAAPDANGLFCLDNVDVGGVIPKEGWDLFYLLALLNNPVANFIWKRGSKPFRGGYGSANKQFIKSLPIPNVNIGIQKKIGSLSKNLSNLYTEFNKIDNQVFHRIISDFQITQSVPRKIRNWRNTYFSDLFQELKLKHEAQLSPKERDDWEEYIDKNKDNLYKIYTKINMLEKDLNNRIYNLYQLSDEEVTIIESDKDEVGLM